MNKIKVIKNEDSVVIKNGELFYEVYFDKHYHTVFMGESGNGILVEAQSPDTPNGSLKIEYHPAW